MTERLYYRDSYLKSFQARVLDSSPDARRVYLDRTAFYPTSGGQPFDVGSLSGIAVEEVVDEGDCIAHTLAAPVNAAVVEGAIDWVRRFDHMQQHTGQHLLSAVFVDLLNANTVSFHLGAEYCTIDLAIGSLQPAQVIAVEKKANQTVFENRPVRIEFQDASLATDLRKASEREGELRIVSIDGLDRSACGGTHVRATGEIGPILIRKLDKIRNNVRVEFLCGGRAISRARADFDALSQIAKVLSAPIDDTPALVTAQIEKALQADKARRRLSTELATARGRQLYNETQPDANGLRKATRRVPAITEELRAEAQSFTAQSKAVLLVLAEDPPSALLAASKDSGLNAGRWLQEALTSAGGRGGGSPIMAQGSLPTQEALDGIAARF
ncbi:MAG: alanyl-tRNA editing protein [Acidobacteriaceae bacterium]|nr:alanyl-tRNA editing protein [Acidobacteriaceae bacterium]